MHRISVIAVLTIIFLLIYPPSFAAEEQGYSPGELGFGQSYVKDTIPDRMEPGRSYPVLITFKNSGLVSWESRTHRVGMVYGGNLTELVALPVFVEIPPQSAVLPSQEVSFALTLLPVGLPGMYSTSFSVVFRNAQGDQRVTEVKEKRVTIVPTDGISSPLNGSIVVESLLGDLAVSLDGVPKGFAPCIIPDLSPGTYEIQVLGSSLFRKVPVQVEKGTLSRVFIDNLTSYPRIEQKKVGIVSDGTLIGYIKANVPLLIIVSLFVLGCIAVMIHAVRLRREKEQEGKDGDGRKGTRNRKKNDDDPVQLEKDLLDEYHSKPPIFDAVSAASDPGSGSSSTYMKIYEPPQKGLKDVREFSREMLDKKIPNGKSGGAIVGAGGPDNALSSHAGVEFNLHNLEAQPGFAKAHITALNHSSESLFIEGYEIESGTSAELELEVPESETDEYEMTISLKVLSYIGDTFYGHLQIPYNRGMALLARGIFEKAYEFYQDAIKKNPRHLDALLKKYEILIKWGLEEEAQALIDEILALDPDHKGALDALRQIADKKKGKKQKKIPVQEKKKIPGFPDILYDRYTPVRLLGKDAFASIILVIRNDTNDLRALKIAHNDVEVGSSFYAEISILYQLRHLNVLKLYHAEFNPTLFLELEYISGIEWGGALCRTLADMKPPLPDDIVSAMIEGIASGVAYFHSKGVRHYSLSPKYILLDEPMTPKISGFIHSSLIQSDIEKEDTMIVRALEQKNPEKYGKLGKRTDLFQIGVIWYWLLTGKMPYQHDSVSDEGIDGIISGEYLPLCIANPEKSHYDPLLRRLLVLEKRERYGSANEFLADLFLFRYNSSVHRKHLEFQLPHR